MIMFGFLMHHIGQTSMPIAIVRMMASYDSNVSSAAHFDWDESQKNDILGSFFWGNVISKVPAGRLSEIYGPRMVFGVALIISTAINFLTPAACSLGAYGAIVSRVILGISLSFFLPALPTLLKKWVPPTNRTFFISDLLAFSLLFFFGLIVYGYFVSVLHWTGIFYFIGCIHFVWTIAWFRLIYDSPEENPRIADDEKFEIQKAIKEEVCLNDTEKIPWWSIITSGPVWACLVAYASFAFSNSMTSSQMPSYLRQVIHAKIKNLGLLANVPYLVAYLAAVASFFVYSRFNKRRQASGSALVNFKRLFSAAFFVQLLLFLAQTFFGYSCVLTIMTFSICEVIGVAGMLMILLNTMDLCPNFSGTIYGIAGMSGDLASYLQTKIVAHYTYESQDFQHWQSMFLFVVATKAIGLVVYCIFSSRETQRWAVKDTNKDDRWYREA